MVFAMANPDPEITYDEAKAVRQDIIMATGRSDFPNQVNNVLGFPFIFRGALDVHATTINEEMKLAATYALAALAKEDVPDSVCRAYGVRAPEVWPRLHHSQAIRSARAGVGSGGGRQGSDGDRSGAESGRPGRIPRATRNAAGQGARTHAHHDSQGAGESQARACFPKDRTRRSCAPVTSWSKRRLRFRCCSGTAMKWIKGQPPSWAFPWTAPLSSTRRSIPDHARTTCRNCIACGSGVE